MKRDVPRNDEAVSSVLATVLVLGLTVMVGVVVGAQSIETGSSQPMFAHAGVVTDLNSNGNIEVDYLENGGVADYVEVRFSGRSATGVVRLNTPGARATLAEGGISTVGDAETVRQPGESLGENVLVTAIAFNSKNGASSSTLVYQDCVGRCTSSRSGSNCSEDADAGHGNNCDKIDPDNPGKGN